MKNLRIPLENQENHTNPELYVTFIKTKNNHENQRIPRELRKS